MKKNIYTAEDIIAMDMNSFKLWVLAMKTGCLAHIGINAKKVEISTDSKTGDIIVCYEDAK